MRSPPPAWLPPGPAEAAANLDHPHIAPIYDYWREPGRAYIVTRYFRGGSLRALEERGEALQHQWARVIAARCRGLLSAAGGDLAAALSALERAFELHKGLGQPFELARTHLVMGTIRRRSRQKRAARDSLQAALNSFEQMGARLWAERARAELARI